MCGIVGIIGRNKKVKVNLNEMKEMAEIQRYRGPDDFGMCGLREDSSCLCQLADEDSFCGSGVVAFNRLSIRDVSANGHQPMLNKAGNVGIAFNGEIYNCDELRNDLIQKGYNLWGTSDTEVVLNLYMEYGLQESMHRLNGMFAIVIMDMRLQKIFLVRDRFGIKPLYITNTENYLLVASEIKSFLRCHEFQADLNFRALQEYCLYRSTVSDTMFRGVFQILPGEYYVMDLRNHSQAKHKFFDINEYTGIEKNEWQENIQKQKLWEVFSDAVRRQMVSDVKVGCQLSGGIDSSLVAYVAAKEYGLSDTVSAVVDFGKFSEEKYIDTVSRKFDTEEINVKNHKVILNGDYFSNKFIESIWHFESITAHASVVGVYQIAERAKKHVTVLLSGEGADEVFGGYECFTRLAALKKSSDLSKTQVADFVIAANGQTSREAAELILPGIDYEGRRSERLRIFSELEGSIFNRQRKYEMRTYLPELFMRQDKMSMANSIENRVPFMDNAMVEMAFNMPESLLMNTNSFEGKNVLKMYAKEIWGESFAYRSKMGFGVPTNLFLNRNPRLLKIILKGMKQRDIVNWKCMQEWNTKIDKLKGYSPELFYKMCSFEVWCQLFLDNKCKEEIMDLD